MAEVNIQGEYPTPLQSETYLTLRSWLGPQFFLGLAGASQFQNRLNGPQLALFRWVLCRLRSLPVQKLEKSTRGLAVVRDDGFEYAHFASTYQLRESGLLHRNSVVPDWGRTKAVQPDPIGFHRESCLSVNFGCDRRCLRNHPRLACDSFVRILGQCFLCDNSLKAILRQSAQY
jgi:hypothetical protein